METIEQFVTLQYGDKNVFLVSNYTWEQIDGTTSMFSFSFFLLMCSDTSILLNSDVCRRKDNLITFKTREFCCTIIGRS